MGEKGSTIVISPSALIPAIAQIRVENNTITGAATSIKALVEETLRKGDVLAGQRAATQVEACEVILKSVQELAPLFQQLATSTQQVYERYIDAETQKSVDKAVTAAASKVSRSGQASKLKGK